MGREREFLPIFRKCVAMWLAFNATVEAFTVPAGLQQTGFDTAPNGLEWREIETQLQRHQAAHRACGPLSAIYFLRCLGHPLRLPLWQQRLTQAATQSVSVGDVLKWCREVDPTVRAWRVQASDARKALHELPVPCILLVDQSRHCVVVDDIQLLAHDQQLAVSIWDPTQQARRTLPWSRVFPHWSGGVISRASPTWWESKFFLAGLGLSQVTLLWLVKRQRRPSSLRAALES